MSDGGDRELLQGSSWAAVRRGLRLLIVVWVVLTLMGVLTQMLTADLSMRARVGDEGAATTLALASFAHQVFYSLFALALTVAALGLTRAPPSTRAISLGLTAAAAFVLVFVLNIVVGMSERTPEEARTTSVEALRAYWVLLALARGIGVVALLAAVLRLCAALGKRRRPLVSLFALGLAALDGGYPVYRLLAHDPASLAESSPWLHRGLVLGLQLAVAFFVIDSALRARRAAANRDDEDTEEEAAELEDEVDEPEAIEPAKAAPESKPTPLAPQSRREQVVAAVALAIGLCVLPLWDAASGGGFLDALRGAPGTTFPTTPVVFVVGGGLAGILLLRALAKSPYAARGVFGLAASFALGYLGLSAWDTALDRSRRTSSYAVCETMAGPDGEIVAPDPGPARVRFEGPRLPNGQPCTSIIEDRATHREEHPDGSFRDGMIQISRHFPDDRARFFSAPAIALLLLVISGVIVARAARLPRQKS